MTDREREQERRAEMFLRRIMRFAFYVANPVVRRQYDAGETDEPLTEDQELISAMWDAFKESERRHLTRMTK
jgi:hypothetical protein